MTPENSEFHELPKMVLKQIFGTYGPNSEEFSIMYFQPGEVECTLWFRSGRDYNRVRGCGKTTSEAIKAAMAKLKEGGGK